MWGSQKHSFVGVVVPNLSVQEAQTGVPVTTVVPQLLLAQRRHGDRDAVCGRAYTYATLAGVGWSGADGVRALAFGGPEHVPKHSAGGTGSRGRHGLYVASRGIIE